MKLTLVVLAAGIGSRFGGLKQVEAVGPSGEFLIDYSVYDAIRAGFSRVVFVIRREMDELFRRVVGERFADRIEVGYVYQELGMLPDGFDIPAGRDKPWGTAHATLVAWEAVHGPFVVINADDFYGRTSYQMLADFLNGLSDPATHDYAMAGFRLAQTVSPHGSVSRGVCETDSGQYLKSVTERTKIERRPDDGFQFHEGGEARPLTGDEIVSMNIWAFTLPFFEQLNGLFREFLEAEGRDEMAEFFLPRAVDQLIARGEARVKVLPTPDRWFGFTYPGDKKTVQEGIRELVADGQYPDDLWGLER